MGGEDFFLRESFCSDLSFGFPIVFYIKDNYIVIWVRMHAQFPISKPNLLLPVAISIKKET